jgi:hypothetical protein
MQVQWDPAEWLERLTANAVVATVLGSIPAFSDTVESEWAADEAVLNIEHRKKNPKNSPLKYSYMNLCTSLLWEKLLGPLHLVCEGRGAREHGGDLHTTWAGAAT